MQSQCLRDVRATGIPFKNYGIRLDSGDLGICQKELQEMLGI